MTNFPAAHGNLSIRKSRKCEETNLFAPRKNPVIWNYSFIDYQIVDKYAETLDISYDKEWFNIVILIG